MRKKSLHQTMSILAAVLAATNLLVACGTPTEQAQPAEPTDAGAATPAQEEAPDTGDTAPGEAVNYEDLIYPRSEFLFEVFGFGGPMMPWRFYATSASIDDVVAFYTGQLPAML